MISAIKSGWTAFKRWWNSLSSWVRGVIITIWTGSIWELYTWLRDLLINGF